MIENHWFDALNKRFAQSAPRRGILGAATALAILQQLGAPGVEGKGGGKGGKHKGGGNGKGSGGKNGRGNKGNGKGRGSKKPKPPKPTDICDTTWPGKDQQVNRGHCRDILQLCPPGSGMEFCIVTDFPGHEGDPVADCCAPGEKCCGEQCCPEGDACCDGLCCPAGETCCHSQCCGSGYSCLRGERGDRCCRTGSTLCDGKCCNTSDPWTACCDGQCVNTEIHFDHCGACGNRCLPNETCVSGHCECRQADCVTCPEGKELCGQRCVDTKKDPKHCGGCFAFNPNGLKCCEGNLCHYTNGVCCGSTCYPEGWPSCG